MEELREVISEVATLMGMDANCVKPIGQGTFVNTEVTEIHGGSLKYYGCYYIDENYDWGFDSPMDGIGCNFVTPQELEDGTANRVDTVDTVENEFPGLRGVNRKKFRLAMEKLCDSGYYSRSEMCVNILFMTPKSGDSKVIMFQILNGKNCWVL